MSSTGVEKRGSAATVRACDSCRKRKRRCVWSSGAKSCTHCIQLKEECATTHIRKQRTKSQKRDRIADYENRIKSLEALLKDRSAAQPHVQVQPLPPPDKSIPFSAWMDNLRTEVNAFPTEQAPGFDPEDYHGPTQVTPQKLFSLDAQDAGVPVDDSFPSFEDFEPSADFQEDAAILQDPSYDPAAALSNLAVTDSPTVVDSLVIQQRSECDAFLPTPELGASLLTEFLVDFNTVFPLYRPYAIAEHLRICYEGRSDGSGLAWASAYVVLGIAHRSRGMSTVGTPEDNQMADWYLAKMLPALSGLLVAPPTLPLVQALLGIAMLMRCSPQTTPHALFVVTALRIAQSLAYTDDEVQRRDPRADVEQQVRVFWLAFILDTDESMLSHVPVTHRREDLMECFPAENPEDSLGAITAAEGTWKVNVFALRIRLVLLQAEAIEQVLSCSRRETIAQDVEATARRILGRLKAWRNNELFRLEPAQLMQLLYRSDLIHVLSVEASYFATVFRIHAFLTLDKDPLINPFSTDALTRLASQTEHAAYEDAERLLLLLSKTPHGDIGICWMIKLPVFAALTTVLAHYLHCPEATPSADAMREYARILRTLGSLVQKSQDLELQRARQLCLMQFTRLEAGLRMKWLQEKVDAQK